MTYSAELSPLAEERLVRLKRKNRVAFFAVENKVRQIQENPHRFKPLSGKMTGIMRVHIDSSFVLTYRINEQTRAVIILDYDHHDKIYR